MTHAAQAHHIVSPLTPIGILYCIYIMYLDIDSEFKTYLCELVPLLLDPENLVVKKINGSVITGRGLLQCFKVTITCINGNYAYFNLVIYENF